MRSRSLSRIALFVATAVAVMAFSPVGTFAQACPGGGPLVAGVPPAAAMFTALAADGPGAVGDNFIEIPAFSPINAGGFPAICSAFGLLGTPSTLIQINAATGMITTHVCNLPAAPAFTPCQGVLIRPSVAAAAALPLGAAGVEGSWRYPEYGDGPGTSGDHLFGIPRTTPLGTTPAALCMAHGLPAGATVTAVDPAAGMVMTHMCGAAPVWALRPGSAVLVRVPGPLGVIVAGGIF